MGEGFMGGADAHLGGEGGYIPCPQKEKCLRKGNLPRKSLK